MQPEPANLIRIVEVGPRDGLQNEPAIVPTDRKVELVNALSRSGVNEIEVSSFVSPKWIPQLADAVEVFRRIDRHPDVLYSALVPNLQGLERALQCWPDKIALFVAASETFNQKNINTSTDGAFERFAPMPPRALAAGLLVRGYVSTVFSCPYEGPVTPEKVADVSQRLLDIGCRRVALGDTIGRATPDEVRRLLDVVVPRIDASVLALHFHDTFGRAADNIRAALPYGIACFDGSVGGLGGCPYAGGGAAGNVATEVVVRTVREAGYECSVDLEALAEARRIALAAVRGQGGADAAAAG